MITENDAEIDTLNVSENFKSMLKKMLEKDPNKRYSASQCLRLPVLLKEEQINITEILDDFNIELKAQTKIFPLSSTEICVRSSETTTFGKNSPLPLLKYFYFVAER